MNELPPVLTDALVRAQEIVLSSSFALQAGAVLAAFLLAMALSPRLKGALQLAWSGRRLAAQLGVERLFDGLTAVSLPLIWIGLQWLTVLVLLSLDRPVDLLRITLSLLMAWIAIRLVSRLIASAAWTRLFAGLAWIVAALAIVGILDDTVALLDGFSLTLGDARISALSAIKSMLTLLVLLWLAALLVRAFEHRVAVNLGVGPAMRLLLGKLLRFVLFILAALLALSALGIDLTALALFGGAVGIGVGLGLQPIIGNLVSGVLMLMDRSIKPGDIITVGDTLGWVESLNARYVSVRTRDGVEHLIPNEDLVTMRVENWSHSDRLIRLRAPIGISYGSDVRRAIELCIEAAAAVERVVDEPGPRCLLRGFGNSSVDLELRFWITDPEKGRANVTSEVLLGVWDRFHEHGIEIPFPQRDLHLKSAEPVTVRMQEGPGGQD